VSVASGETAAHPGEAAADPENAGQIEADREQQPRHRRDEIGDANWKPHPAAMPVDRATNNATATQKNVAMIPTV